MCILSVIASWHWDGEFQDLRNLAHVKIRADHTSHYILVHLKL